METNNRKYILLCLIVFVILSVAGLFSCALGGESGNKEEISEIIESDREERNHKNGSVLVYVTGAVKEPGVYELPRGSHCYEAVQKAGDVLPYADLDAINLAAEVEDESHIYIPINPEKTNTMLPGKININTAEAAELATLPGVGPKTADKIIGYRSEHGAFKTKEELKQVPSIGEGKFAKLAEQITL